jgi:excisionase family DNA binding protein
MIVETPRMIGCPAAAEILGLPVNSVRRLVRLGRIGSRKVPGTRPLLFEDEVMRLAEASTRRASTPHVVASQA